MNHQDWSIQASTFWHRFWKKTSLTGWLFQNRLINLLLKHLTLATARAWIHDYSDLLWQFLSGYFSQQQVLSCIFCAIQVSSDWQKARLYLWSQTNPRRVPLVATRYQTTECRLFLRFYFIIFSSIPLFLFHRKWELYPELLNHGMSPKGGDRLTAAESFKTWTNKSFVVTE